VCAAGVPGWDEDGTFYQFRTKIGLVPDACQNVERSDEDSGSGGSVAGSSKSSEASCKTNLAGVNMTLGTGKGGAKYYCGRNLGVDLIPGTFVYSPQCVTNYSASNPYMRHICRERRPMWPQQWSPVPRLPQLTVLSFGGFNPRQLYCYNRSRRHSWIQRLPCVRYQPGLKTPDSQRGNFAMYWIFIPSNKMILRLSFFAPLLCLACFACAGARADHGQ
jgi:hypothetical protein